jgi:hypothetical protein
MSRQSVKIFIGRFGHQLLITSASVSMTAQFASSHNILWGPIAWAMAIGFEWAWLRGLAQAGETRSVWVNRMVKAGASSVVVYGVLWCLIRYEVIPDQPGPEWGIALALAHVLPIAYMAYCSANIHREIEQQRAARIERLQDERDALELERLRKEQELELWHRAQQIKAALRRGASHARPAAPPIQVSYPAPVPVYECPRCGSEMTAQEEGARVRHGERWRGCKACRAS